MATIIENILLSNGENYFLQSGYTLVPLREDVVPIRGEGNNTITIEGRVEGPRSIIHHYGSGDVSLAISDTGIINSYYFYTAVYLTTTGAVSVENDGSISAGYGIKALNSKDSVFVSNSGLIEAVWSGIALQYSASAQEVHNSGVITTEESTSGNFGLSAVAIQANAFDYRTPVLIENTGSLIGREFGIQVHSNSTFASVSLNNSGIVSGGVASFWGAQTGNDQITNSGILNGSVYLEGGHDSYQTLNEGSVIGVVYGGEGRDTLTGGAGKDEFHGEAGKDSVFGGDGADKIFGGDGADTLKGGKGNDTVTGGDGRDKAVLGNGLDVFHDNGQGGHAGRDMVFGGNGNDTINGGAGNDVFWGENGNDSILGGNGADKLSGGANADVLKGGNGNDTLFGGQGNDQLFGSAGLDVLFGRGGNDTLSGGDAEDVISGGQGDDQISGGKHSDALSGGDGTDTFVYYGGVQAGNDTISDFEDGIDTIQIINRSFSDLTIADQSGDTLVTWDNGTILLSGVSSSLVSADDFTFITA